jgi:NADH dehydrogenase
MAGTRVVIIGGGFAGVATARELERAGKSEVDVTLVSRQNFMLFTPMLPEVASGAIDAHDIMQPLRVSTRGRRNTGGSSRFELGEAVGVDVARRTVTVRHPLTQDSRLIEYDELVLAVGATDSTMGVAGVEKFAVPLKTIEDAQIVRRRVIGALEAAATASDLGARDRFLRFVIIGGDFTGVELAGELLAFLRAILGYYPSIDPAKVELVVLESGARLLGHLPDKFGKYAAAALSKRGARLRLNEEVSAIDGRGVELKSGERIASGTVIWAAGEKPSPLADILGLTTNKHGAIETGADFAVAETPHVWALGDCAAVPMPKGGTYAPLAQIAVREGPLLARNIIARIRGRSTANFSYEALGQMASLGDREAVVELPGGAMLTGFVAWVMWRTYYLGRLPGLRNKTRVALDWTLGLVFPPSSRAAEEEESVHAAFR